MLGNIFKLSNQSLKTSLQNHYDSMLAGNASFIPAAGSMVPIGAYTVGSTALSSITFGGIPQIFSHLQIRYIGFATVANDIVMKVNTSAGLKDHFLTGLGSGTPSATSDNPGTNGLYISNFGFAPTNPTVGVIDFLDYTNSNKYSVFRTLTGRDENGSGRVSLASGLFDTSPITSITFSPVSSTFSQYTNFALYGWY